MRMAYLLINAVLIYSGYWAFTHTDLSNPDSFYSVVLPIVDMVWCIYLLLLMFIEIYNRTWK